MVGIKRKLMKCRQHTLLGIVVGLCASGNTLLGIAVGLCGASGNTPYWALLLVYEGSRTTHFTRYCLGLYEVSGSTLCWASLGLMYAAFIKDSK
jgi:hypothetical protein